MEIIFLWTRDYPPFKENTFNFNGRFNVTFNKNEDNKNISISIVENQQYPTTLFGNDIVNISCLIGKNGSGKTRLLELLKDIRFKEWYTIQDYLQITFNKERNEFDIIHNLYEEGIAGFHTQIIQGEERYTFDIKLPEGNEIAKTDYYKESQIVYYAPFLDLKNIPLRIDNKPYVDVSTDFLVLTDKDSSSKENPDVLELHRFKNIERQFEFIHKFKNNLAVNNLISVPNEIEVHTLEQGNELYWDRNLSISAQEIRTYFIGNRASQTKGIIIDRLFEINGKLQQFTNKTIIDHENYKNLLFEKSRLHFLEGFIQHYFTAWNSENHWLEYDIGISVSELKNLEVWEACKHLMKYSKWIRDNENFGVDFLNKVEELLTFPNSILVSSLDFRRVLTKNQSLILDILRLQSSYFKSLPIYPSHIRIPDVIQIDWRNLSSGEKAYLDLFSRLNYGNTELRLREEDRYTGGVTAIDWLYLFIDEGEMGFHPEWQKSFVNLLHKMIPFIFPGLETQVILTSHSPFIASDIPIRNIVFLDKVDGKVIVNEDPNFQNTFGANIHTLLADGFFLSNGLIGDFAKNVIQEVINWINNEQSDLTRSDEIRRIIEQIGEPIVRNKIIDEFNRKLGVDDDIYKIDREMEMLRQHKEELLKKIKNAKS